MVENVDIKDNFGNSAVDLTNDNSTPKLLSEFLASELVAKNDKGQFLPNNKQLKSLVDIV